MECTEEGMSAGAGCAHGPEESGAVRRGRRKPGGAPGDGVVLRGQGREPAESAARGREGLA